MPPPRYAYCKLEFNPAYPTTFPYGLMRMKEAWTTPMYIAGWMKQLPPPRSEHGFSFNWKPYDRRDCKSTYSHFNPTAEPHGYMNGSPSHVGDLKPIIDDSTGNASYGTVYANRPTLFWGTNSVARRSMVVYERRDDFGEYDTRPSQYNGSMGREIACCNVQLFRLRDAEYEGP